MKQKILIVAAGLFALLLPIFYTFKLQAAASKFEITDTKFCLKVGENRQPIDITSEFPKGTETAYCWFSWTGADPRPKLVARWHYVSEDIHILDTPVNLTRTSDFGVLSLKMPAGKAFPAGSYRLDLEVDGKKVRSLPFAVLETSSTPKDSA